MKSYWVYLLTNHTNSVLYIGVTGDLKKRIWQHKNGNFVNSFTKRYRLYKLVWFEEFSSAIDAIAAEKKIKGWKRNRKIELIERVNSDWNDLL